VDGCRWTSAPLRCWCPPAVERSSVPAPASEGVVPPAPRRRIVARSGAVVNRGRSRAGADRDGLQTRSRRQGGRDRVGRRAPPVIVLDARILGLRQSTLPSGPIDGLGRRNSSGKSALDVTALVLPAEIRPSPVTTASWGFSGSRNDAGTPTFGPHGYGGPGPTSSGHGGDGQGKTAPPPSNKPLGPWAAVPAPVIPVLFAPIGCASLRDCRLATFVRAENRPCRSAARRWRLSQRQRRQILDLPDREHLGGLVQRGRGNRTGPPRFSGILGPGKSFDGGFDPAAGEVPITARRWQTRGDSGPPANQDHAPTCFQRTQGAQLRA